MVKSLKGNPGKTPYIQNSLVPGSPSSSHISATGSYDKLTKHASRTVSLSHTEGQSASNTYSASYSENCPFHQQ